MTQVNKVLKRKLIVWSSLMKKTNGTSFCELGEEFVVCFDYLVMYGIHACYFSVSHTFLVSSSTTKICEGRNIKSIQKVSGALFM